MKSRTCRFPGCTSGIRSRGLCKAHGGGKRCSFDNCEKSDQGGGFCITHGGGKRCAFPGCEKSAQVGGKCKKHGGFRKCDIPTCMKSTHALGLCRAHIRSRKKKTAAALGTSGLGVGGGLMPPMSAMNHNGQQHHSGASRDSGNNGVGHTHNGGSSAHHHHLHSHMHHSSHSVSSAPSSTSSHSLGERKMAAGLRNGSGKAMMTPSSSSPVSMTGEMPSVPTMGFPMLSMGPPGSYQYPYSYAPPPPHQMPRAINVEVNGPPQKGDQEAPWNINELISLFFDPWKANGGNMVYYNGPNPPPGMGSELPHPQGGLPMAMDYARQRYNKINGIHV